MGLVVPSLIALPALALMARMLGVEKFGIFMLAFSVLGYASVFDGGITRAVIRSVAINNGNVEKDRVIMGTATWTILALSSIASILLYGFAKIIVTWLNVSNEVTDDAIQAFKYLSLVVPAALLAMVWFSYPEGRQQFAKLNIYKTISGSLVAVSPVLALYWEPTLSAAILGLLLARVLSLGLAYLVCRTDLGRTFFSFHLKTLKELFSFGGWITVSNIISPIMVYADRFILSNLIGAYRVAFYAAPADAIARMSIVPGAVSRTIFPIFSENQKNAKSVANQAYKGLLLCVMIMVVPTFIWADTLLTIWLGQPYGVESGAVFRVLLVGFIFNAMAQIPFARIQGHGKSKLTAMIHLCELLPYLAILGVLVYYFGLLGAAIAWTLRVLVDCIVLEYFSRKIEANL